MGAIVTGGLGCLIWPISYIGERIRDASSLDPGFLLPLCCIVPIVVPHFLLNEFAYGASPVIKGSLLLLDSILVGFIALLMGCTFWTIYRFRVLDARTGRRT